ncbi:unnamed protein product [Cuscuta epithymum]|uniref:Uncharacterized protein n=1 Tax=Cuscuta epithymum TaxID=186058 RepID=A0AAV0DXG4_9ASTE|nr:unnamed protein product [Cuscuta epithymum]
MSELRYERTRGAWKIYKTSAEQPSPSQVEGGGAWRNFGTSANAICFGLVATAILISMFLIMAIFEHLFKQGGAEGHMHHHSLESGTTMHKLGRSPQTIPRFSSPDFTVLMPGQQYPTFIAQPAPLPCQREGVCWPSHVHNIS